MSLFLKIIFIFLLSYSSFWSTSNINSKPYEQELYYTVRKTIYAKKAAKIDSFFTSWHKKHLFNGAVLFAENGVPAFKKAYGYSNFRTKDTLTVNSTFQLASVSKPITATAVLMLYENGQLDLDDKINKFFPSLPYSDITVRLLLTHRSGLPNYMYFSDRFWHSRRDPISNEQVLQLMEKHHPMRYYLPNRRYNYSNTNYSLLASLIEKVSGMSYQKYLRENIFEPLGMKNTWVYDKSEDSEMRAQVIGYNKRGRKAENSYLNGVVGDKGIYSTVEDLFKFDQALYDGKLVSVFTLKQAYHPAHQDLRLNDNYGFGWRINENNGDKIVYHSGWWKGFKTFFIRKIKDHKTLIVLTNTTRWNYLSVRRLLTLL